MSSIRRHDRVAARIAEHHVIGVRRRVEGVDDPEIGEALLAGIRQRLAPALLESAAGTRGSNHAKLRSGRGDLRSRSIRAAARAAPRLSRRSRHRGRPPRPASPPPRPATASPSRAVRRRRRASREWPARQARAARHARGLVQDAGHSSNHCGITPCHGADAGRQARRPATTTMPLRTDNGPAPAATGCAARPTRRRETRPSRTAGRARGD